MTKAGNLCVFVCFCDCNCDISLVSRQIAQLSSYRPKCIFGNWTRPSSYQPKFCEIFNFLKKIKKIQVLFERIFFIKLTEHYVESILKLICKDRMKNESRIIKRRFLAWPLFQPDGRELVNRKKLTWSITGKLVQFVEIYCTTSTWKFLLLIIAVINCTFLWN